MLYIQRYRSPLGEILMAADDAGLVGLWFAGQKHFAPGLTQAREQETPVLAAAGRWLDLYFAGRRPHFIPPLHLTGTEFRMAVNWPGSWLSGWRCPICPLRRWAARWDTTPFP